MAIYESPLPSGLRSLQGQPLSRPATQARERDFLPWLAGMFSRDRHYHAVMATLTASENYASRAVRAGAGLIGGQHYFFDAPVPGESAEWSFPVSSVFPALQQKFLQQMRTLFAAGIADWRPNGGSTCEQAVVMAACQPGEAFVQIGPDDGGHFGNVELARSLGIESFAFPVADDLIDVAATAKLVEQHPEIRLLFVQPSHTRRAQPVRELAARLARRLTIAVDVSHTAGLIAGGVLPQPLLEGADILTFNTHKTLPGPNKGVIAFADPHHPLTTKTWQLVCPGLQSNSHVECLPGLVLALEEMALYGSSYAEQTVANARRLAEVLDDEGLRVAGIEHGGTETHQVHLVLGPSEHSNSIANVRLPTCGIRTNSVMIPGTGGQFGLRLGTQALTRRGLTEPDFTELGQLLSHALEPNADSTAIRGEVATLLAGFPLHPLRFSFDEATQGAEVTALLAEALH